MKTPLDKNLNKVYESFNQNHNHLRQKFMASLPDDSQQQKREGRISHILAFTGDTIMKNRITKLAAAAAIIIALFAGLYLFMGPVDVASVAWADVLEEMKNVRSVTFKVIDGRESVFREFTLMKPGYERCVTSLDTHPISFRDHTRQRTLDIYPESKRAVVIQRVGWEASTIRLFNYFRWFEDMQNKTGECIDDQEKINGKIAQKFVVREGGHAITFWVDPETNLPVKVKFGSVKGGRVMKDFVWNPELDESIFIFDPPDGYTVTEIEEEIPTGPRPRRESNSNNEIEGEIPYPYSPRPRTDGLRPRREPNSPPMLN